MKTLSWNKDYSILVCDTMWIGLGRGWGGQEQRQR